MNGFHFFAGGQLAPRRASVGRRRSPYRAGEPRARVEPYEEALAYGAFLGALLEDEADFLLLEALLEAGHDGGVRLDYQEFRCSAPSSPLAPRSASFGLPWPGDRPQALPCPPPLPRLPRRS